MNKTKGLFVMDVDSTLIQEEVIDLLGAFVGHGHKIAEITERAMNGELDFKAALAERVALLKGLPVDVFQAVGQQIHLNAGAKELINELHQRGFKVGLVSGGFHELVNPIARELEIDYVRANHLEVVDGILTGKTLGEIVTKDVKVEMLQTWTRENQLEMIHTVAMGDGANDLPMILTAGIGIAFNAKPVVRKQAPYQINVPDLYQAIAIIDEVWK